MIYDSLPPPKQRDRLANKQRTDFLAGQFFDIRLEVHAPVNGSQANGGVPDPNFSFTIEKVGGKPLHATKFFKVKEPALERWNFTWYEGMSREHVPRDFPPS